MKFLYTVRTVLSFLTLIIITCVTTATAQKRCLPGFFDKADRCVPCPPGFYRSGRRGVFTKARRCSPCPAGTFNPVYAAVAYEVCRQCPTNTFSESGSAKCAPCPPGLTSNRGAKICLACGPGTRFSPTSIFSRSNPSKCIPCQKGSFSTGEANLECTPCPDGQSSPKMSTSKDMCRPCPPGKYSYRRGCSTCSLGSFKAGRSGRCLTCPPGTTSTSPEGAKSCSACPRGTRALRLGFGCKDCPPGTTTAAEGAVFCRAVGEPCPSWLFENAVGNCESCAEGFFHNVTSNTCQSCPQGSVSRGGANRKCRVCPPGTRPDRERENCICKDGMVLFQERTCKKCPAGTFSRSDESTLLSNGRLKVKCNKCTTGTFQDESGATTCKPCPMGLVSTKSGAAKCVPCPRGLVPSIGDGDNEENAHFIS